jgi:hypothetical protein
VQRGKLKGKKKKEIGKSRQEVMMDRHQLNREKDI